MRTVLCVLCVAMCSGTAIAQEGVSNFDACVSEAKQRHTDAIMETYFSYKCDGVVAQRLAARPD
jgi:epoxyqueuosine reductase QueG